MWIITTKPKILFAFRSLIQNFATKVAKLLRFGNKRNKFLCFALNFSRTLASPKLLSFGNEKEKRVFFLHFAHLFVTLQAVWY